MSSHFRTVAVLGRHTDQRVAGPMIQLVTHLKKAGLDVVSAIPPDAGIETRFVEKDDLAAGSDLIIAIGGDGTMLYAAGVIGQSEVPLLGINRGRLGFLADISPDDMLSSVDHVLDGNFTTESRLLLSANLKRTSGEVVRATALNDVVMQRRETGRMVDIETSVDGQFVNTHSGDGLIVSTPTGSTAYALSCGGPIIEPALDALVVVPICPHTLTDRPIVISAQKRISIRLLEREDTQAEVAIDGHSLGALRPEDELTIEAAANRLHLAHPPGYDYFNILRSKLFWGKDSRLRQLSSDPS